MTPDDPDRMDVVAYARHHGLSRDHRQQDPLDPGLLQQLFRHEQLSEIPEPPDPVIEGTKDLREKLTVPVSVLAFFKECVDPSYDIDEAWCEIDKDWKSHKIDLPVLQSTHELDVAKFLKRKQKYLERYAQVGQFAKHGVDYGRFAKEKIDEIVSEEDTRALHEELEQRTKHEKLTGLARQDYSWLKEAIEPRLSLEELEGVIDELLPKVSSQVSALRPPITVLQYHRPEPLTPPLLPLSSEPDFPSTPSACVPLMSDVSGVTSAEIGSAYEPAEAHDVIRINTSEDSNPFVTRDGALKLDGPESSLAVAEEEISFGSYDEGKVLPTPCVRLAGNMKMDVPLLTEDRLQKSTDAVLPSICIPEVKKSLLLQQPEDSLSDLEACTNDPLPSLPEGYMESLVKEQLSTSVPPEWLKPPAVDFSLPEPPWVARRKSLDGSLLPLKQQLYNELKPTDGLQASRASGLTVLSKELDWNIFKDKVQKISVDDVIEYDEKAIKKMYDWESLKPLDTVHMAWCPDPNSFLNGDEDEDEDELLPLDISNADDKAAVLINPIKRKTSEEPSLQIPLSQLPEASLSPNPHRQTLRATEKPKPIIPEDFVLQQEWSQTPGTLTTPMFSTTSSLAGFMNLHQHKAKKPRISGPEKEPTVEPPSLPVTTPSAAIREETLEAHYFRKPATDEPLILTDTTHDSTKPSIIASTELLSRRELRHILRPLATHFNIIERDFRAYNPSPAAAVLQEADLAITAGLGLVFTTFQQLRQRALPGQKHLTGIRQRVAQVSCKCERLIVLVLEDRIVGARGTVAFEQSAAYSSVDNRDFEAMADFSSFVATLECAVSVVCVRGTDEQVRERISSLAKKSVSPQGEYKIVSEDSMWEVFLRRAGLNALAAQVMLSHPSISGASSDRYDLSPLAKILTMSLADLHKTFREDFGGIGLLDRFSKVVGQTWAPGMQA